MTRKSHILEELLQNMFHRLDIISQLVLSFFYLAGCRAQKSNSTKSELRLLKGSIQNQVPTGGFLEESYARTKIDCAILCTENQNCAAMYYLRDIKVCKIHAQKISPSVSGMVTYPAVVYYEVVGRDPATTTPTTTIVTTTPTSTFSTPASTSMVILTEGAPCPPDDSSFRHAQTSAGTQFEFRVLMDAPVSFSEAEEICKNHGAKPYKILNADKLAFTLQLMTCPAYTSNDFWINGVYNESIRSFVTLEGEPIPEPSNLWAPGRPNGYSSQPCMWISNMHAYLLDDRECYQPTFTICEI